MQWLSTGAKKSRRGLSITRTNFRLTRANKWTTLRLERAAGNAPPAMGQRAASAFAVAAQARSLGMPGTTWPTARAKTV